MMSATNATSPSDHATLLISCPDRRGIVAEVSAFIFGRDGNIIHADQHSDAETQTFYMRVEWERSATADSWSELAHAFEPLAKRFAMTWDLHTATAPTRTAIFVSKQDHCLWDLLLRQRTSELNMNVRMVISNHADLAPVAATFGVPFHHIPVSDSYKAQAEADARQRLEDEGVELIVLARYMQILTPEFTDAFSRRVINIHHSFLPAFTGARPYHRAYERGVKIIGATSHYVTADLDQGPIIEQDVVHVSHRDSVADMMRKGRDLERIVLSRAVRLHLERRIHVCGNKTVVFD